MRTTDDLCEEDGCRNEIDPGDDTRCDPDYGCGGWFCDDDLYDTPIAGEITRLCVRCYGTHTRRGHHPKPNRWGPSGGMGPSWSTPRAKARRGAAVALFAVGAPTTVGLTLGGYFWAGAALIVGVGAVIAKMARHDLQIENAERKAGL